MSKSKMLLDPNARGDQWLYRGCLIQYQDHPKLLKYACYSDDSCNHLIGTSNSRERCKGMIDGFLIPRIENKPKYCHAWTSDISKQVMCNSIPFCGFTCSPEMEQSIKKEKSFKGYNKIGKHPLTKTK